MTQSAGFLRSDCKSWVGSALFFMSINRLKLNDRIYHLPVGDTYPNSFLQLYVDSLCSELLSVGVSREEREYYDYVRQVTVILKKWAEAGYGLTVA